MNAQKLFVSVGNTASKIGFKLKQKSPELCLVAGILSFGATIIFTFRAAKKVDEVIIDAQEDLANIEEQTSELDVETEKKQKTRIYIRTAGELTKLFGPAAISAGVSLACFITSHKIQKERNLVLGAAYSALDRSFRAYRERVEEKFGKETEKDIRYGISKKENIDDSAEAAGDPLNKEELPKMPGLEDYSIYARFFDEACGAYVPDPEDNLVFLRGMESKLNARLKARGHLYLNEVYEALGIPPTKAGHHVGWIYDYKNPTGDNFVSFGIYKVNRERNRAFVNGLESVILLDFNVDGVIDEDPRAYMTI